MNCIFRRRLYPSAAPTEITVTVTGSGNASYCYAIIGGTKRSSAGGPYEVQAGDTITIAVAGHSSYHGSASIDGTKVLDVTSSTARTYAWTVPAGIENISVNLFYLAAGSINIGTITVTTS